MHNARSLMNLSIVMSSSLFCLTLSPETASAQVSCGGAGELRAVLTERYPPATRAWSKCRDDMIRQPPVSGRRQPVLRGTKSLGTCVGPTSCGGRMSGRAASPRRATTRNPIPFSGGCRLRLDLQRPRRIDRGRRRLRGVRACAGQQPLSASSRTACAGRAGRRACARAGQRPWTPAGCPGGMLSPDALGICRSCGAQGQPTCALGMCAPGLHPEVHRTKRARAQASSRRRRSRIATAPAICTEPRFASQPVNGYADLHLHMFSNLAFGGLRSGATPSTSGAASARRLRADRSRSGPPIVSSTVT